MLWVLKKRLNEMVLLSTKTYVDAEENIHNFKFKFVFNIWTYYKHSGSYMSADVLLNLLNELRKRDKMQGLSSILSLFRNEFS